MPDTYRVRAGQTLPLCFLLDAGAQRMPVVCLLCLWFPAGPLERGFWPCFGAHHGRLVQSPPPPEASISSHPFCSVPGNAPFIYWQRPLPPQPSFRPSAASPNCSTTRSHSVRYRPPSLVSHFSAFLKDGSARVGQGPCLSRCFCGRKNSRLQLLVVGAGRLLVRGISSPQTMLVSSSIVARGCVGLRAWKGLLQWTAAAPRIRAA